MRRPRPPRAVEPLKKKSLVNFSRRAEETRNIQARRAGLGTGI
jgi:hypothetical protein